MSSTELTPATETKTMKTETVTCLTTIRFHSFRSGGAIIRPANQAGREQLVAMGYGAEIDKPDGFRVRKAKAAALYAAWDTEAMRTDGVYLGSCSA